MSGSTIVLAQHGGGGSGGELPMTIMLVTVLVLIWLALGVVCWIFWRAKKREDYEGESPLIHPPNRETRG